VVAVVAVVAVVRNAPSEWEASREKIARLW